MATSNAEALEAARKRAAAARDEAQEAEKGLRKWKSEAKEAAGELEKAGGKIKRLSTAVQNRESPERAISAVLPAATVALATPLATNYLIDKLGGASAFVSRNADLIKGGVTTVLGLGVWAGELATRQDGRPLDYGRDVINRTSEYSVVLGLQQLSGAMWRRHKANQRALAAAQGQ